MAAPSVNDCVTPDGMIDLADFWPQLSEAKAKQRVRGFITDGVTEAEAITDEAKNTRAVTQWVYYRAASEALNRLSLNPGQEDARDEGSHGFLPIQFQYVKDLRDSALAAFQDLVDEVVSPGVAVMPRASRTTQFEVRLV